MSQPIVAHGAHTAWRLRRWKAILKLLPSILEKSNAQIIGTILLVIITIGGAIMAGIVLDGYAIQHPVNLIGHCPSPLVIRSGSCYQEIGSSVNDNGKITTSISYIPAGTISYPNGSSYG